MAYRDPAVRLARYQAWSRVPADVITCPECGRRWQRTQRQRKDGTVRCTTGCWVRAGNLARSAKADGGAAERYRAWVQADPHLRLVSRQEEALVGLLLAARREGMNAGRMREARQTATRRASSMARASLQGRREPV